MHFISAVAIHMCFVQGLCAITFFVRFLLNVYTVFAKGVWAKDIDVVNMMTRGLKAGTVWINSTYNSMDCAMPMGGVCGILPLWSKSPRAHKPATAV